MRQTALGIVSGRLLLEGILSAPDDATRPWPGVVVCHPHPMLGGNMESSVVVAVSRALVGAGMAALRFNFRGAGGSQGAFAGGDGEGGDVKAALRALARMPGVDKRRLAAVGYSFGATVLLKGLAACRYARCLVLIAPPAASLRLEAVQKDRRPKLFIAGSGDRVAPPLEVQRALDDMIGPVRFVEIPGAGHGLLGFEQVVAGHAAGFLAGHLAR